MKLTEPQRRHLSEMVNDEGNTRYWRPQNAGERRCAWALRKLGLLSGSDTTYNDAYYLNDAGLALAKSLACSPVPEREQALCEALDEIATIADDYPNWPVFNRILDIATDMLNPPENALSVSEEQEHEARGQAMEP